MISRNSYCNKDDGDSLLLAGGAGDAGGWPRGRGGEAGGVALGPGQLSRPRPEGGPAHSRHPTLPPSNQLLSVKGGHIVELYFSCIYSFRGIACKLFCLKGGHMPIIHRSYHCRIGSLYFLNSDSSVEQKSSLELRSKNLLLQKQQLFPPTFEMILWPYSNENTHDKLLQVSRLVLM